MPRTTLTLDPDVDALVRKQMRERGVPYKVAVNDAIRAGLADSPRSKRRPRRTPTFKMGFEPALPWDKALRMAADLEDEELLRRLAARK
jgi:hypothetical protein